VEGSDLALVKMMWNLSKDILTNKDKVDRRHSARGVWPHSFHTYMSLRKLWVANRSLDSTSATLFVEGSVLALSQNDV